MKHLAQATTRLIFVARVPMTAAMAVSGSTQFPGREASGELHMHATPKHSARKHEGIEEER